MNDSWYDVVPNGHPLTQGDIIPDCPVLDWKEDVKFTGHGLETNLDGDLEVSTQDVIVMTQACDIANDKVSRILLCPIFNLSVWKTDWERDQTDLRQTPTPKSWSSYCTSISNGYQWNVAILNSDDAIPLEHKIVQFDTVYTLPKSFLTEFVKSKLETRVRLRVPYREHLSQAFARFFMRVGLPNGVKKGW